MKPSVLLCVYLCFFMLFLKWKVEGIVFFKKTRLQPTGCGGATLLFLGFRWSFFGSFRALNEKARKTHGESLRVLSRT